MIKGEVRTAKRLSFGKIVRKLSDITNSPLVANNIPSECPKMLLFSSDITENYVNKLIQENSTLVKLIDERNKIIELSGAELQRLRISYQKTQLQNWNLAQSNSQMLAELRLARDKVNALQHELACRDALLKAKRMEAQGKLVNKHVAKNDLMEVESVVEKEEEKAKEIYEKADDKQKPPSRNRRHHQRSQSLGTTSTTKKDSEKEKAENKRRCVRRQSERFVLQEREQAENLFEIEEAKFPISHPDHPSPIKDDKENNASPKADELGEKIIDRKTSDESCRESTLLQRASIEHKDAETGMKNKKECATGIISSYSQVAFRCTIHFAYILPM